MKKILLIEDSKMFYDLFRRVFKDYDVLWADNGKKGIELFSTYNPDLIVVDIILPDMNGVQIIEKIREKNKSIVIIALSGIEKREVMEDIINAGANEYLPKSYGVKVLRKRVESLLKTNYQNSSAGHLPKQSRQ